jgi:hypothetical protein
VGVLSSLLPGLRDVRAPLAAGYVFLFDLWLTFADGIPSAEEATGVAASIYRLEEVVSSFGLAVAISFVAYLLGVFFDAASNPLIRLERAVEAPVRKAFRVPAPRRGVNEIYERFIKGEVQILERERKVRSLSVDDAFRAIARTNASYGYGTHLDPHLAGDFGQRPLEESGASLSDAVSDQALASDRTRVLTQLMTTSDLQPLYGEYDRQKSEARFRTAIFLPLVMLLIVLSVAEHPLWSLLVIGPVYLLVQAGSLTRRAEDSLTGAISSGRLVSPFLTTLAASLEMARSATPTPPR